MSCNFFENEFGCVDYIWDERFIFFSRSNISLGFCPNDVNSTWVLKAIRECRYVGLDGIIVLSRVSNMPLYFWSSGFDNLSFLGNILVLPID